MRFLHVFAMMIVTTAVIACGRDDRAPLEPATSSAKMATSDGVMTLDPTAIPDRAADYGGQWVTMSNRDLWDYIVGYDSLVNVGLKAPGVARGIWRNQWLITPAGVLEGRRAVLAIPGAEFVKDLTGLPAIQLRVLDPSALSLLRALPFVDYVEPNALGGGFAESLSCGYHPLQPQNPVESFAGDTMPPHLLRLDTQISKAWNRARGEGVVLGLTDTGISGTQGQLLGSFDVGYSSGRWHYYTGVLGRDWRDSCSHGTRMAGVMTAPMNSENVAGVAWRSHLVSANQADGVFFINGDYASEAIRIAAQQVAPGQPASSRRIVTMAWQSEDSNVIADVIRYWYSEGRLFIAASGSVDYRGIAFPAQMSVEVIAVSAVNGGDYSEINGWNGINYGDFVDLTFPVDQLTNGEFTNAFVSLGGSSGATAAVSGIAALVWSQYPNESNIQIAQRLEESGHIYPDHNRVLGHGVPNAMQAVGGLWYVQVTKYLVSGGGFNQPTIYDLVATPDGGEGPYTYLWNTGATSNTIRVFIQPGDSPADYSVTVSEPDPYGTSSRTGYITIDPPPGGCDDPFQIDCQ